MSIEEVLTEIRLCIGRHPEPYTYWADAIRAEMEEKERLRAALRTIANLGVSVQREEHRIARAALAATEDKT